MCFVVVLIIFVLLLFVLCSTAGTWAEPSTGRKTPLRRRTRVGGQASRARPQGVESGFCFWIEPQRLAQKARSLRSHRYGSLAQLVLIPLIGRWYLTVRGHPLHLPMLPVSERIIPPEKKTLGKTSFRSIKSWEG